MPQINTHAFQYTKVSNVTLYVLGTLLETYKQTDPWNKFGTIMAIDAGNSEIKKCAKPSIAYEGKNLYYVTATPEAAVIHTIACYDTGTMSGKEQELTATYNITAYATKSGYINSDVATATLVWATATFTTGETTNAKEMTVDALPLLITQEDGMVTVSGIADGTTITAYGTNGTMVATAKAIGSATLLNLSDLRGKVAVLNVAGKSAKIMVK